VATFAELNNTNEVIELHTLNDSLFSNESEANTKLQQLNSSTNVFKQYYFDGTRKNPAIKGGTYDSTRDAFLDIKPYSSWILNETTCKWEPPIVEPTNEDEEITYVWDEDAYVADNTTGWVETDRNTL